MNLTQTLFPAGGSSPAPAPSPSHPSSLFPQIARCRTMRDLAQVHAAFIKTGQINDTLAAAEILRFCATSDRFHRDLEYAHKIFKQMRQPNCFSWNTMIRGFSESDEDEAVTAITLFCEMIGHVFVGPNRFTFPSVLKACAKTGKIREGKQIHGLALKFGLDGDEFVMSNLVRMYVMCDLMKDARVLFYKNIIEQDRHGDMVTDKRRRDGEVVLWNVMIDGYVRLGDFKAARMLFDKMRQRSVVSWNTMISGYSQNGFLKEAVEIFQEMQSGEIRPNYVTLLSVLPAISRLGSLELGEWIHLYAEKNGIEIDDVLGSALIDMYSKCGIIEKAVHVFERLPRKNAITWSAMINGFAMHGQANEAIDCFHEMEEASVRPSDVVYIGLLTACSHAGFVEQGRRFFSHMLNVSGLEPRIEHYGCMVDLLGRSGHLKEAEELILNMPMKPDDVIWKALLGACKIHGNIEMGERVAGALMEMAPHDSGAYVALSNMYASRGNWAAVSDMRVRMKEMDIRKDPGSSWIDIDGAVHEFLVEDESHPRSEEIRSMLLEISEKLRSVGYRPITTQVLLNLDEEDKENALYHHSERIAVAFGLISAKAGASLRIVKNLRICEDCHSSFKLISKVYGRHITVRDRKRFHHFKDGSCSCLDFW
ncbi:PREDICTED: pentatricopeptide repeat-containing protein At5g48910 [Tarenaya hassleriana]|uniref:pentatricopeptide repeat-containing protein At5g48910 n=1 Tax=Tarenaya hassleriana TaxID=28532 RepID=UPI00053C712E|nr:PREDICTED: pentatricopeptide repeat-containing protein At5g48910 [Tarenaya hassleriana]